MPGLGNAPLGVLGGGSTVLTFSSPDGAVKIRRVRARHRVSILGGPGWGGGFGFGESTEAVCVTPCAATVPNGSHEFDAGGHPFEVDARGGSQTWEIERRNGLGYWSGFILASAGSGLAVAGAIFLGIWGIDDSLAAMYWGFLGGGLGGCAIGFPLWLLSEGSATQVVDGTPSTSTGAELGSMRLVPSLLAGRGLTGERYWGAALTLTL